ncbi:MAG: type II secretion system protein [bacterium]|nr:type II secretion system protein [bacterium]
MKNKGFTLTELIAVIVIIGLVLLITIPITKNIIEDNEERKLTFYVQTVEKALYTYADMEMVNGIENKPVTLEDLTDKKYLESYSTNAEFEENITLSKDESGKVTINGKVAIKGNVKVKFDGNIICSSESCSYK